MEQPLTPSSLYGGGMDSNGKLSPVSHSSFRAFSRNFLASHQPGISSGSTTCAAPIALTGSSGHEQPPSVDKKTRLLDDKLARFLSVEETKFALMEEACKRAEQDLLTLREERQRFNARKQNEIVHLGEVLNEKVNKTLRERQESVSRIEDRILADLIAIESEMKKLKLARLDAQGNYAKRVGDEIHKIQSDFNLTKQLRSEKGELIANAIHDELIALEASLTDTKDARLHSESEMVQMVEEMCLKIRDEMDNERELRQFGEEQLLQLLEETCNRVEANFQLARRPGAPNKVINS